MHRCSDWDFEDLEGGELFPGLTETLCSEFDELKDLFLQSSPEHSELRNHDCMWAGLCVSDKHENAKLERLLPPTPTKAKVIAPTNARSVLLPPPPPPRVPDRPDTPMSENELELDLPYLCDLLGEQWMSSVVPSEVTGQVAPPQPPPPPPAPQPPPPCTYTSYTDHCYYSTLPPSYPIHTDNLGVQTPSDSEEEIDVETVADARKPGRPACSPCRMPTEPTPQDRWQIQRTVSNIMRRGRPPSAMPDRRRRKRRHSNVSSMDYQCARKLVKRKQYRSVKCKRKRPVQHRNSSSDSEDQDGGMSVERRSLHNNLERQRRIDLRNSFEELRVLVPETMDHDKAAKVVILNSGAEYCQQLEYTSSKLQAEKAALKKQQERLRQYLADLRRSLARAR